jgi:hypothetical protein
MTEQEIRALDSPGLCRLAWELGLAPDGIAPLPGQEASLGRMLFAAPGSLNYTVLELWEPYTRLDQADAALRLLRAHGWSTSALWLADDRRYGVVWAATAGHHAVSVEWYQPEEEARALLLTAVLAAARDGAAARVG